MISPHLFLLTVLWLGSPYKADFLTFCRRFISGEGHHPYFWASAGQQPPWHYSLICLDELWKPEAANQHRITTLPPFLPTDAALQVPHTHELRCYDTPLILQQWLWACFFFLWWAFRSGPLESAWSPFLQSSQSTKSSHIYCMASRITFNSFHHYVQ